jgi:iron complex outermembrane recepter protein
MIKPRRLWSAYFAGVITCLTLAGRTCAQAPASSPSQNPASVNEQDGQLQQITVTGYIIPHVGDGPQPVVSYDRDYIQKSGNQTVTDVILNLPSAVGNFAPNTTSGFGFSPGAASVSLKGLPPNDTLVLVDGRRMPAAPFNQVSVNSVISFVDLNTIPLAAVDRIEVLNDGGSATYGTDAIAGVVNVILKDEYNGADISNYYGISQRGDDETYHGSLVGGCPRSLVIPPSSASWSHSTIMNRARLCRRTVDLLTCSIVI